MVDLRFKHEKDFRQWNEAMARRYDPEAYHLHSNFLIRWVERRRVRAILQFLHTGQDDRVLEVGCGAGNILEQIPSRHLHGIDLSHSLLAKSQRRLAQRQVKLAWSNAEHLPFADRQFQKLVCSEVLEHVANPRRVLHEMARVAAADAVIVISIPNERWIDRVKTIISILGLGRWLLQGPEDSYRSPHRMTDEWHLHSFDLALLQKISKDILLLGQVKAIPFSFIPLRYAVCCQVLRRAGGED